MSRIGSIITTTVLVITFVSSCDKGSIPQDSDRELVEQAVLLMYVSKFISVLSLFVVFSLLLQSCRKDREETQEAPPDPEEPQQIEPTFSRVQTTIFNTNCALSGCHSGPNPQQGQNLSAGQAYANIVGVPSRERHELFRISAGSADESYLYLKITGHASIIGGRMPLNCSPLSASQIELVRQWIENGALNN